MTTMFNTMPPSVLPRSRCRSSIIAALWLVALVALVGCSLLKVGYGQANALTFRWLDRYVDFDDAQSLRVHGALDDWFAWHRRTQLPDYADLFARAQGEVLADTTPERMCAWGRELRGRVDTALERAAPAIANVVLTLSPEQIAHIEKRYHEANEEYRDEFVQRDPAQRRKAMIRREIERAEMLYESLDDAQRDLIARAVAASPADPEMAYAERKYRQQDALVTLRRLAATRASNAEAEAQVRAYLQRVDRSPREGYRSYAERLADFNCAFASALHNSTSAAQRRVAARKLKAYEVDLRALAAEASN